MTAITGKKPGRGGCRPKAEEPRRSARSRYRARHCRAGARRDRHQHHIMRMHGRSPCGTRWIAAQIRSRQEPCHDCDEMGGRSWNEAHSHARCSGADHESAGAACPINRTGSLSAEKLGCHSSRQSAVIALTRKRAGVGFFGRYAMTSGMGCGSSTRGRTMTAGGISRPA